MPYVVLDFLFTPDDGSKIHSSRDGKLTVPEELSVKAHVLKRCFQWPRRMTGSPP